ncbi:hypothetical protein [uncultured Campylobacter sp.]|uniref:hypothetical protein n=1 Tax=uncultured Campylobacter sp. TaxID=218934 RepID=UPI002633E1E6|nr:hypothetical protein [uncultured Campylobacter sp.]
MGVGEQGLNLKFYFAILGFLLLKFYLLKFKHSAELSALKTSIALEFRLLKFSFEILRAASFAEARPRKPYLKFILKF